MCECGFSDINDMKKLLNSQILFWGGGGGGGGLRRRYIYILGMGHDFRIFYLIIEYRLGCAIIF